ncbi:MAG: hypothetical protein II430_00285 [Selenomonas sp.]|nr:hypothetical protein [Selenomonas sp.]MBQ2136375.1 hypothetical protein [Selenomonas sp.]MBQ4212773.1 hypothetical protein [Selenomonas sp.]
MSVLGNTALTLSDWRKRMAPDGSVDFIIEALMNANPIMDDIPWMMGNLPTGNKTTIRSSMPTPSIRRINRGVERHKSQTEQVTDTTIILEDRSVVDIELLALAQNGEAFRRSEDAAFVAGFSDAVAANIFYGDTTADAGETFNGIAMRYNEYGDASYKNKAAYQVISAGTAGTNNTSGYFVGWGTHATTGIYPKGSQLGLQQRDLGESTVTDANGREYQAVTTLFTWKCGLAVGDIRANAAVRNIDMSTLGSLTSAQKLALVEKFIRAKNRIRGIQSRDKKVVLYVGDELYNFFELYLLDKNNVHITRQELMNAAPQLYLSGIPIKKCDAISEEEPAVQAAQ